MASNPMARQEEIDRVFTRSLPLLESALTQEYRLTPREAAEIQQSLLEWFRGFARRPGSPNSVEALRRHLLSMTCQAGHVYCSGRLGASSANDERLQRALTLGPQQIAIEIEEQAHADQAIDNPDGSGRSGA
jgi:hypothetical protein